MMHDLQTALTCISECNLRIPGRWLDVRDEDVVTVAEFWDCRDPGPLADGDHRRIFAAEPELGVLAHEA
jgi:hypothetical protein